MGGAVVFRGHSVWHYEALILVIGAKECNLGENNYSFLICMLVSSKEKVYAAR